MPKKEMKRTRYNLKGREVLHICRSYVEAGVSVSINIMLRVNQESKVEESRTMNRKRMDEPIAAGCIVPRKKK